MQAVQALLVSATHFPVKWVFTGNFWEFAKFTHSLAARRAQKLGVLDTQFPKKNTGNLISITGIRFIDCSEIGKRTGVARLFLASRSRSSFARRVPLQRRR